MMKVLFRNSFAKDLEKVPMNVRKKIKNIIVDLQNTDNFFSMNLDVKKIKGYGNYYRFRVGQYRVGIEWNDDTVIFCRVLNRKSIYKYFP